MDDKTQTIMVIFTCLFILLLGACNLPAVNTNDVGQTLSPDPTHTNTPIPQREPTHTQSPSPPPPEHRIGIRELNGAGEFYDRTTGEQFVPRGNNYVRLDPQLREDGGSQIYHSVFDPGLYDRPEITAAFQEMHDLGYNTVRVFVSQNTIGSSGGLNPETMNNIIDFLQLAREYQLFIIFTQDWLPGGKYGSILNQDCCENFTMMNVHFLTPAGLKANQVYFQDFVRYLLDHNAPVEMIFSYQLRNELFFDMNFPPLSFESGLVTALNGETYDMSSLAEKHRMADENMVLWIDGVRQSILELDATALVSVGFFWPQEPNPARIGDPRYINTAPAIWESQADFIDLHPYPGSELTLAQYVENFGMQGTQEKPILMGEFGVTTSAFPSVSQAASLLMNWQVESCQYGFDGWLLWTWDIYENHEFYSAKSGDGEIGQVLAPVNRPDPCQTAQFDFIETNLALDSTVNASRSLPEESSANAVDGSEAQWGAGASPPQWIEIDLGQPHRVKTIRLMVAQYPEGETRHEIYARDPDGSLQLLHTFEGLTQDNQVLTFTPEIPLENIQAIRVVTTLSPSWVAWKEIEIIQ